MTTLTEAAARLPHGIQPHDIDVDQHDARTVVAYAHLPSSDELVAIVSIDLEGDMSKREFDARDWRGSLAHAREMLARTIS
jgi:hypothetical protein